MLQVAHGCRQAVERWSEVMVECRVVDVNGSSLAVMSCATDATVTPWPLRQRPERWERYGRQVMRGRRRLSAKSGCAAVRRQPPSPPPPGDGAASTAAPSLPMHASDALDTAHVVKVEVVDGGVEGHRSTCSAGRHPPPAPPPSTALHRPPPGLHCIEPSPSTKSAGHPSLVHSRATLSPAFLGVPWE